MVVLAIRGEDAQHESILFHDHVLTAMKGTLQQPLEHVSGWQVHEYQGDSRL